EQNRLEFENALRGLGMSKHFSPLLIEEPHSRQGHFLPAIAFAGTPVEPLISEGMLFFDILKLLNFSRQIIQDFCQADYSHSKFFRRPCGSRSPGTDALIQLLVYHLEPSDEVILRPYVRL